MKYLKLFENFQSEDDIKKICKKYKITNYTINNGLVDVDGEVYLTHNVLNNLPLKFGNVSEGFYCNTNYLSNLEGSPQYVGMDFACANNQLASLIGAPNSVGGYFDCSNNNKLTSLEGAPKEIKGTLFTQDNPNLYSLKGLEETKFKGLDVEDTPFYEIYKLLGKWDSVATYEYFYWDFLYQENEKWYCDLDNLNSFLMVMTDEYKIPYQEVTELKNYKCV